MESLATSFENRPAVVATMHGKERILGPLLKTAFGIEVFVPSDFDTDRFGTFTRDVRRPANQRRTARLKALAALELTGAELALASEGSFGTHPDFPFAPCDTELVLLLDRQSGLEIIGGHVAFNVRMAHAIVHSVAAAREFALAENFPRHGLVLRSSADSRGDLEKDLASLDELERAVAERLRRSRTGAVFLESDLRAHRNPTRQANIAAATEDLIRTMRRRCPGCRQAGFALVERIEGLPCRACGLATRGLLAERYCCAGCGYTEQRSVPESPTAADPAICQRCNP